MSRVDFEHSELVRQHTKRNTYRPECVLARLQDSIALSTAQTQIDNERIALPILRIRRLCSIYVHQLVHHFRPRFLPVVEWPMRVRQVAAAACYC